jgi:NDP-sugar pyrophosphorylase family protein
MLRNLSRSNVDDVQVVIPMAGKSQRFFDAGYDQPKFLIEFFGLPMIGHILRIFQNFPDVIVIVNEQDKIKYDLGSVVSKLHGTAKVVSIKQHSFGPSYSILESSEFINQSKKIIVHYCDFSGAWDPYDTVDLLNTYNGVFVSFTGFHPSRINGTKFAYGRASSEKALMEIKEKGSFTADPETEYASSGIYGFSTGGLMLESIGEQVRLNLQINGEF